MSERISQAEFARRINKSPQYVGSLVKEKKLKLGKDKKLDYEESLKILQDSAERITNSLVDNLVDNQVDETKDYKYWKAYEVEYKAKQEELDYLKKKKELVDKYEIEQNAFAIGNLLKEQLLSIPERYCNIFASESDAMVIRNEWIKETKRVLKEIADRLSGVV